MNFSFYFQAFLWTPGLARYSSLCFHLLWRLWIDTLIASVPVLLMFVFYFNSSEYWNIGQYEKKIKYIYANPRLIWPVCSKQWLSVVKPATGALGCFLMVWKPLLIRHFPGLYSLLPSATSCSKLSKTWLKNFSKVAWMVFDFWNVTQICSLTQPFLPFFYQTRCRWWSKIMHFQTTAFCPFY